MTEQATVSVTSIRGATWAVDHFRKFWSDPDPTSTTPHLSAEIVGHWPDGRVLHGIKSTWEG